MSLKFKNKVYEWAVHIQSSLTFILPNDVGLAHRLLDAITYLLRSRQLPCEHRDSWHAEDFSLWDQLDDGQTLLYYPH